MRIVITGSEGRVGSRLMKAFPGAVGVDRTGSPDIRADLATIDYDASEIRDLLRSADALVHLGANPNPRAPEDEHWQSVVNAARLLRACARDDVKRVVLASSDWAEPQAKFGYPINSYGHSKRAYETMAAMYGAVEGRRAVALRVGWVPTSVDEVEHAEPVIAANYWPDDRVIAEFKRALGLPA